MMDSDDDIAALFEYQYPIEGSCDGCPADTTTLFYETPDGATLCRECARSIRKPGEADGLDRDAITVLENSPDEDTADRNLTTGGPHESSQHLTDVLTKVTPAQSGAPTPDRIEYEYDCINWSAVEEANRVGAQESIDSGGIHTGSVSLAAGGFDAVRGYLDSLLAEVNVVYLTDNGVFVFEYLLDRVATESVEAEVFRVVSELAQDGVI